MTEKNERNTTRKCRWLRVTALLLSWTLLAGLLPGAILPTAAADFPDLKTAGNPNDPTEENRQAHSDDTELAESTVPKDDNSLVAIIDGTEYVFTLDSAKVNTDYHNKIYFKYIQAKYVTYNPRGEALYELLLNFDANLSCGTYEIIGDNYLLDLSIGLFPMNSTQKYQTMKNKREKETVVGSFTITERSDDWETYSGYCDATLRLFEGEGKEPIQVEVPYFNFTLTY